MNIKADHCNRTRYLVKRIGKYWIVLHKLDSKPNDRNCLLIIPLIPMEYGRKVFPFTLMRLQFPIKIAFILIIKKAQGQSATKCGLLLPKVLCTYGHIYVAYQAVGMQTIYLCGKNRSNFIILILQEIKNSSKM